MFYHSLQKQPPTVASNPRQLPAPNPGSRIPWQPSSMPRRPRWNNPYVPPPSPEYLCVYPHGRCGRITGSSINLQPSFQHHPPPNKNPRAGAIVTCTRPDPRTLLPSVTPPPSTEIPQPSSRVSFKDIVKYRRISPNIVRYLTIFEDIGGETNG